ncbi:hypothetical protein [Sulfitobacter guttiformis]|uniref:Uncharacterized protein n=1 Tax=Sulfitobacter guttiformis TaxID=74349 RepID=A0A420DHC0_9RHOB|nr:hypothetical protein [Sulfitobacter guttiformis]KIN72648.1 hypothetical protein Z949_1826 [Sulfitobacter guttiformis KCTC 32187]RKE93622.1 hypothetical protein C8N30_2699 [Sulfitobacter guttiformis]
MKNSTSLTDVRTGAEIIDMLEILRPSCPEEAGEHHDIYDLAARFDGAFYEPARSRPEEDMTFDFVKLEGVLIPAIDAFEKAILKADQLVMAVYAASMRGRPADEVMDRLHESQDGMQTVVALSTILKDGGTEPGRLRGICAKADQISLPIDRYLSRTINKIGLSCVVAAREAVIAEYHRIARDGRVIDKEKALVDGAMYALKLDEFTVCRDFIERMNEDEELISEMTGYVEQVRHDVLVMIRTSKFRILLENAFYGLTRPVPKPEGWSS